MDEKHVAAECQAGCKKATQLMITCLFCWFWFRNNRKLYVVFIDFEKAFDSINRNLLWDILFNFLIMKFLRSYNKTNLEVFSNVFDVSVQPVLQYGAEIWGLHTPSTHHLHKVS